MEYLVRISYDFDRATFADECGFHTLARYTTAEKALASVYAEYNRIEKEWGFMSYLPRKIVEYNPENDSMRVVAKEEVDVDVVAKEVQRLTNER